MNLPAPPGSTIWKDMAEFQHFAEDVHAHITDPNQKKMLGDLLQQLTVARAKAQEVVPGVLENMKKQAEAQQAEVPKVAAELERLQTELEAKRQEGQQWAEQAKKPAAAPKKAPVDPGKGRQLTAELLNRFAPAAPQETPLEDAGSVAREWVETEPEPPPPPVHRPATSRTPTMRPTPTPKKPVEPAKEGKNENADEGVEDIWEGLSRMEGE